MLLFFTSTSSGTQHYGVIVCISCTWQCSRPQICIYCVFQGNDWILWSVRYLFINHLEENTDSTNPMNTSSTCKLSYSLLETVQTFSRCNWVHIQIFGFQYYFSFLLFVGRHKFFRLFLRRESISRIVIICKTEYVWV